MSAGQKRAVLSNEIRKSVIDFVFDQGMAFKEAANLLSLKKRTVYNVCTTFIKENRIEKKPKSGRKKAFDDDFQLLMANFLKSNNEATSRQVQEHVRENSEVYGNCVPSITTIDRILKRRKVNRKNRILYKSGFLHKFA